MQPVRCLWFVAGLVASTITVGASTTAAAPVAYEEILVKAPFAMPVLKVPVFSKVDFVITDFGAKPNGETINTAAIRRAIEACHNAGGGRVVIPKGTWLTGAVHLKSNVNLHLAEGAVLSFTDNPQDYLPAVRTAWEGWECYSYSPLIYAFEQQNVAVSGKGRIEPRMVRGESGSSDRPHTWKQQNSYTTWDPKAYLWSSAKWPKKAPTSAQR